MIAIKNTIEIPKYDVKNVERYADSLPDCKLSDNNANGMSSVVKRPKKYINIFSKYLLLLIWNEA